MNQVDKVRIIERYDERLKTYGATIEALASGTDERRKIRFSILKEIGINDGDSILDLGCGFGDLYSFFKHSGLKVHYTGVDINVKIIENALIRFPEIDFRVLDIQEVNIEKFDYVVSSSSFNLKLLNEDNYVFVESLLNRCYNIANKGVAIDFLSSYVDFKGNPEQAFYYSPEKIFSIAKSITKRVCIRHDYPLFEFCVYMYPDFQGWGKK
jgi:ubiquinone/menaquinone biosynthesis C-methylase UbiE